MKSFLRMLWPGNWGKPQAQVENASHTTTWQETKQYNSPPFTSPQPAQSQGPLTSPRTEEEVVGLPWQPEERAAASAGVYTTHPDPECPAGDRGPILGIDLGTSHAVVAVVRNGKVEVIPNHEGERLTPSVVAFTGPVEVLVGALAQRQAVTNPRRTIASVKRFLGRCGDDLGFATGAGACSVSALPGQPVDIEVEGKRYTPAEITAFLLRKLKEEAEQYLQQPVRRAVITVPAHFTIAQRQATLDAAFLAGFDTDWVVADPATGRSIRQRMRLVNEPTAAAVARGRQWQDSKLLVFHMGGGTFDVSILDIGGGVFEVKAVGGDTTLGGDDFDQVLVKHFTQALAPNGREQVACDAVACQRLLQAAEQAKRDLSQREEVRVQLPALYESAAGPCDLDLVLTRAHFEKLVSPLLQRCWEAVNVALQEAGYRPQHIDEVLLIGGMTRMPAVQQLFQDLFGRAKCRSHNPDEMVAAGAAVLAAQLQRGSQSEMLLLDVNPLTLGLETAAGIVTPVIPRNTTVPKSQPLLATTAQDNQPGVSIRVLEFDSRQAHSRRRLGQLDLDGLAPASRGRPRIEVTFDVDANGILTVCARDRQSGRENRARMTAPHPLASSRHNRNSPAGTEPSWPDPQAQALAEAQAQARELVARVKQVLDDPASPLAKADRPPLQTLVARVQAAAWDDDLEELQRALRELEEVCQAMRGYLGLDVSAGRPRTTAIKDAARSNLADVDLEI